MTRRQALRGLAATAALLAGTAPTGAAPAQAAEPFSFDLLTAKMQERAASPYSAARVELPPFLRNLDYDAYRKILYRPQRAVHLDDNSGYQLQAFHLGGLYSEPVTLFEVVDGSVRPLTFSSEDFEYLDAELARAAASWSLPAIAGFRVNYPLNRPDTSDELVAFVGASYFRALGRGNLYGGSARGLAINSWSSEGREEFPRFSAFYAERVTPGGPLILYAELDGPSVTGAYRFALSPGTAAHQDTVIDVTARLFFRSDVAELGIAPLTSMFLYGDANRAGFDDYRPQVHDSNGLYIRRATGEQVWRALNNPPAVANSFFAEESPVAFGLMQRGRTFASYQDANARYERRPSILVEPVGTWGRGAVRLIEIPSTVESEDNIVAFWRPETPCKAGDSAEIAYRLRWGDLDPTHDGQVAQVLGTRSGRGGVSGSPGTDTIRKFVVDFAGGPLLGLPAGSPVDAGTTVTGGTLLHATVSEIADEGVWRLVMDVDIAGNEPVELRAFLSGSGRQLTETWLYQWRAA